MPLAEPSPGPADSADAAGTAPVGQPEPEVQPEFRKNTFGIGAGLVFWPPSKDVVDDTVDIAPAITLQLRKAVPLVGNVGFEFTSDIVFHDFKAMGSAYDWYFKKGETEEAEDNRAMRALLLWPGLILIPFGAANYTTGFGLVVWTSKLLPSMYFDGGLNLNLFLRLSDPQFRADFGFGVYGGLGLDLFKNMGMNVRATWGTPLVHTLIKKTSSGITTLMFNINFGH